MSTENISLMENTKDMRLDDICKTIETEYLIAYIKWSLIFRHDYPKMTWIETVSLAEIVMPLHSVEDAIKHFRSRGLHEVR